MQNENKPRFSFEKLSTGIARVAGSSAALIVAFVLVMTWIMCGPIFHYSNTWQQLINTSTTVITFLMVFIIQQAQNKDTLAIQIKLNELIAATKGASNKALNIEDLTGEELKVLKMLYSKISDLAEKEGKPNAAYSIDEMQRTEILAESDKPAE